MTSLAQHSGTAQKLKVPWLDRLLSSLTQRLHPRCEDMYQPWCFRWLDVLLHRLGGAPDVKSDVNTAA